MLIACLPHLHLVPRKLNGNSVGNSASQLTPAWENCNSSGLPLHIHDLKSPKSDWVDREH